MDVKAMDFPESSFDAIVDKATLDSVLVLEIISSVVRTRPLTLKK